MSSRDGTGKRGRESSNRSMGPFDVSSRYPSGAQYCDLEEAFLFTAGAMTTVLDFCVNVRIGPIRETAVWLFLPIAANMPESTGVKRKKRERKL